ncbi:MAG: hypothetical protein ACREDC_08245 [Bradyrhizobium sp.]
MGAINSPSPIGQHFAELAALHANEVAAFQAQAEQHTAEMGFM